MLTWRREERIGGVHRIAIPLPDLGPAHVEVLFAGDAADPRPAWDVQDGVLEMDLGKLDSVLVRLSRRVDVSGAVPAQYRPVA
ncbi:hypothetical protein KDK95_21330 [Actinospica sp. MGRD01-02]|uniref:Uncharacterized protein n=1 Tax=Actinospica acidithermotolerans TaxID=2828514 RepID=A0A941IMT8_9ACTN|nr:hypothetical protein [Actinospica acidithermotolerans]MBR7828866.1 hypothetical protein [Actinospica acidithermotolerans]